MNAHDYAQKYQPQHTHGNSSSTGAYCGIKCPVHGGDSPQNKCHVWDFGEGGVWAHCNSNDCDPREILVALGVRNKDDDPDRGPGVSCGMNGCRAGVDSRIAIYTRASGDQHCVHRVECGPECRMIVRGKPCNGLAGKHVWQVRGAPQDGYLLLTWGEDGPFNALVMVEGEKKAEFLRRNGANDRGYTPICWRGGASKVHLTLFNACAGREVIFWPDKNPALPNRKNKAGEPFHEGIEAMRSAAQMAQANSALSLRMVDISSLEMGQDAADLDPGLAFALIESAPIYSVDEKIEAEPDDSTLDQFGPDGDLMFAGDRALSITGEAVRLLTLCPENLMVATDEEGNARVLVCDTESGLWSNSAGAIGRVHETAIERWQRRFMAELPNLRLPGRRVREFWDWGRRARSPATRRAVLDQVATAVGILQMYDKLDKLKEAGLVVVQDTELDAQLRYMGTANGVIDLDSGKLLPPEEGRTKHVTLSTGIAFHNDAHVLGTDAAEAVTQLFAFMSSEEHEWLAGFLGHSLWGRPDGWAWLVGESRSGKTTLLEAIKNALGQYAFTIPRGILRYSRNPSSHSEGLHFFRSGARLAVAGDLMNRQDELDSALIKQLATGDESTDRRINVGFESRGLRVTASMMLAFNHGKTPQIAWEDDASVVRLHTLFYPAIPPEERRGKNFQSLFKENQAVKEAMLARLVEYATVHRELPADIPGTERLRQELRAEAVGEELYDWLTNVLERTGRHVDRVSAKEVWDEAQKACDTQGDLAFDRSKKAFTQAVRKVFTVLAPRRGRMGGEPMQLWFGLKWKDLSQHPAQAGLEEAEEQS